MDMNENVDMELTTETAPIVESVIATAGKDNSGRNLLIGTGIGVAVASGAYFVYRLIKKGKAKKLNQQAIAEEAARLADGKHMPAEAVITPITEPKKK